MNQVEVWHLPWAHETVPHGLLDIIRGCNITCDACYNQLPECVKPLEQVEADLDAMLRLRSLSSVSIVGGEVLLHPQLCDIVRMVKSRNIGAEIFTNGVLLNPAVLTELRRAGTDLIFIHIDSGQTRPDLPPHPDLRQLKACWEEKTRLVADHGIDVGLTITAYEDKLQEMIESVRFAIEAEHLSYLLVTLYRDMSDVAAIRGSLATGMTAQRTPDTHQPRRDTLTTDKVRHQIERALDIRPFACMGSNTNLSDPRWLSYHIATARNRQGQLNYHALSPSGFEKAFVHLHRLVTGRFPMYRAQSAFQMVTQLLLNGLTGGDLRGNYAFLARAARPGTTIRTKRILFQAPAEIDSTGRVIHCRDCPDAVIKDGQLVPVCIVDKVPAGSS